MEMDLSHFSYLYHIGLPFALSFVITLTLGGLYIWWSILPTMREVNKLREKAGLQ